MKKILMVFVIFFFLLNLSIADEIFKIGPYVGYYSPSDEKINEFYQGKDIIFGLKTGIKIWKGLHLYNYFYKYELLSATSVTEEVAQLQLTPISFVARYNFNFDTIRPFAGIGYTTMSFKESSAIGETKDSTSGLCFTAGCGFKIGDHFVLELDLMHSSASYTSTIGNNIEQTLDLGGLQAGLSFMVLLF